MAAKVVNIEFVQQDQDVDLRLALLSAVERFLGRGMVASGWCCWTFSGAESAGQAAKTQKIKELNLYNYRSPRIVLAEWTCSSRKVVGVVAVGEKEEVKNTTMASWKH
jgi:hypothetical protein